MGQKMSNAPIYFALAQVRFNTILALDQYLPAIQDGLRKAGYPDFEKSFLGIINLALGPASPVRAPLNVPSMQPQPRYSFYNEGKTSGFILDQSMMSFQTTEYDVFEVFTSEFLKGVAMIHETAGLSYSERIGIRSLDAVCPKPDETLSQYLFPSVIGIYDTLAPRQLVHSYSEVRTKEGNTTLVSRAVIMQQEQEGDIAFPPDLQPIEMRVNDKFKKIKGLYAVIDTDSWLEEREKFDLSGLERRLDALHNELRRSFDLMVTPYALEVWK
jgi:uncharacterized protein (TIGR04255 family)